MTMTGCMETDSPSGLVKFLRWLTYGVFGWLVLVLIIRFTIVGFGPPDHYYYTVGEPHIVAPPYMDLAQWAIPENYSSSWQCVPLHIMLFVYIWPCGYLEYKLRTQDIHDPAILYELQTIAKDNALPPDATIMSFPPHVSHPIAFHNGVEIPITYTP